VEGTLWTVREYEDFVVLVGAPSAFSRGDLADRSFAGDFVRGLFHLAHGEGVDKSDAVGLVSFVALAPEKDEGSVY